MSAPTPVLTVPAVGPPRKAKLPTVAERTLPNGLRVLTVRRTGVPLVELRLRIPFAGPAGRGAEAHEARAAMLAETLLTGTAERDRLGLAVAVQSLGGALSTGVDADRLAVGGSALATNLAPLLGLLAEVLTGATYPSREVTGERDRVGQEITIARSQPQVLVREALLHRLYGDLHPYGRDLPGAAAVEAVTPAALRTLHARRVAPGGAVLILVGDLRAEKALDTAEEAFGGWAAMPAGPDVPPLPPHRSGPAVVVDRPGAVQTNIRLGGPALPRSHPRHAAQQLANTILGGYFTSRLVANLREDKGYTYSPRSWVDHGAVGSRMTVGADVATAVTGPALLEIIHELGRVALLPVGADELEAARQYAVGSLALSTATAAGLASTLSVLAGAGLGVEYLREHPAALAAVTLEDVQAVAAEVLAPARLVPVLLGNAAAVLPGVGALGPVEVAGSA